MVSSVVEMGVVVTPSVAAVGVSVDVDRLSAVVVSIPVDMAVGVEAFMDFVVVVR